MSNQPSSINLIVKNGPQQGQVITIQDHPQVFGRGVGSDIVLTDKSLSRQHARIRPTASGLVIEDLGSTNGTFVNGQRVTSPTLLRAGDTLQLGNVITLSVQPGQPNLDNLETIAPGLAPDYTVVPSTPSAPSPAPGYAPPVERGSSSWLWVGVAVIVALLIAAGTLGYVYYSTRVQTSSPTEVALPPGPTPPPPTETPTTEPTSTPTLLPSPTPEPLKVPGIPAAAARQQLVPPEAINRVDPFCNKEIEVATDESVFINWERRLAEADDETDYLATWLDSAYYDVTLDGRPVAALNYYQGDGPSLNWWANLGLLQPGKHYLRIQWYTNRQISNGLDVEPADGQMDVFGPGPVGDGFCEIVVPEPIAAATATATPTPEPTSTPTPTKPATSQAQTSSTAAPLGIFQDFESASNWKRGDQPYGEFTRSSSQVHSGSYAGQLRYNFPSADNDYVVFLQSRRLAGRPNALSAWVHGDGSGHFLNVWLKDANGQSWQMSFGQVKHTGWQEMTAFLDPGQPWPSAHISGPNNGTIDYPISFQAIVLDDAPDNYSGSGTIYIDDLNSQEGVAPPTPTPASPPVVVPTPIPGVQPPPSVGGLYVLTVGKHIYEPWGAPKGGDVCAAYRNDDFDDRVHMKGFNLELLLTNNSTIPVADNWAPAFITAKNKNVQVCYYGYAGSGPQPGATSSVTFFTIVDADDYVRVVQLNVNGQFIQLCLGPSGAQSPC